MTSQEKRELFELLDLIDDAHPNLSNILTLKSAILRILRRMQ